MDMIERAARSLAHNPTFNDGLSSAEIMQRWEDQHWPEFVDQVRAVLLAIREPNEAMMVALLAEIPGKDPAPFCQVWYAMIDAALAE